MYFVALENDASLNHEKYIERCFELAEKGIGNVAPNPLVGAVIVANNRIIAEGWHQKYGEAHAEVNAVNSVQNNDKHLLKSATIYINLEPCNHFGKTPPCVNLILQHRIPKVIISCVDTNPEVYRKGIERLEENGIEVITGVLEKEGRFLNRRFFTYMEQKRPYVILKWAQTKDGFFAKNDGSQHWITSENSRRIVHKWRSEEAAILAGKNTIKIDNPNLTNRYFFEGKQPVRVIIDQHLELESSLNVFDQKILSIIVNSVKNETKNNLQYCQFDFNKSLLTIVLEKLAQLKLQSVIIEGGANTIQHFIDQNLWDEARILTGKTEFNEGIKAPQLNGEIFRELQLESDRITYIKNPLCNF